MKTAIERPVIQNGIHDISNEKYHASSAVSRSCLMEIQKSPYHYWYKYLSGQYVSQDDKAEFVLGSAVHTLVLEEHKFDKEFFITHQQRRPNKGTAPHSEMLDKAAGRTVMTISEFEDAKAIAKAVKNNEVAKQLIYEGAKIEQSIFWFHEPTGIQVKSRPDIWLNGLVTDLKTTKDASIRAMQRSSYDYGYFLQIGMIYEALRSIGMNLDKFVCVAVEKTAPYPIGIFLLEDDAIDYGVKLFHKLMGKLKECQDSNTWESYGIKSLGLPGWANIDLGEDE